MGLRETSFHLFLKGCFLGVGQRGEAALIRSCVPWGVAGDRLALSLYEP